MNVRRYTRSGLALVELLISLAITATLLTATAIALDASIQAYQINCQQATVLQMERVAMNRIISTIRRSKLHAPENASLAGQFAGGATVTGQAIVMYDSAGVLTSFRYDATNKVLNLVTSGVTHPLMYGVEDFQITMEPMRSSASVKTGGSWDLLKRATVLMSVRSTGKTSMNTENIGSLMLSLSASVMPRRNSW
jgi:Tfp pilus assembly protein PilE